MKKLSTNYKTDDIQGFPPDIQDKVDQQYLHQLANLHATNPKILVVFSGGNGVGKSTLAQKIATELHGLVLENDAIKVIIRELLPDVEREHLNTLTWQYTMGLYERLADVTPNGLVVRDGVIDWYYDRILPVFKKAGYDVFVVAYDISREKSSELITNRGDKPTVSVEILLSRIDEHNLHMKRFRQEYTPDITLTDDTLFDHDHVIALLRERIAQQ